MANIIPRDIWKYEIFPLLDDISFLCLQVAFCHCKIPTLLKSRLEEEIAKYDINFVKYFMKQGLITHDNIASNAAIHGNVILLEYVLLKCYPIYYSTTSTRAAKNGHLKFLQVLYRDDVVIGATIYHYDAIYSAAQAGQLPCLKFLLEKNNHICWEDVINRCIVKDQLEASMFILDYFKVNMNLSCYVILCKTAACYGSLRCLKYYHKLIGELPADLHITAINYDNLNILQYLIDNGHVLNEEIEWQLKALRSPTIRKYLIKLGYRFHHDVCDSAIRVHNIDILQDLFEAGYKFTSKTALLALTCYNFECLKFVCENGAYIDKDCTLNAVLTNNIKALRVLHECGATITDDIVFHSAMNGFVGCLQYALKHKFPVNIGALQNISDNIVDDIRTLLASYNIYI